MRVKEKLFFQKRKYLIRLRKRLIKYPLEKTDFEEMDIQTKLLKKELLGLDQLYNK